VNVDFYKEKSGGGWEFKNYASPTLSSGRYEVSKWGVGVGNWRYKAVFFRQSIYGSSETVYHNFTIKK
jgi:hypothetical protein